MAVEEERTIGLPKPPPPRPARRDAAIDAALRKFDGEAPAASPSSPEPWTTRRRYQLGAFATAALALVIFVPVALTGVSSDRTNDTREVSQPQTRSLPDAEEPAPVEPPRSTAEPVAEKPTTPPPVTRSPAPTAAPDDRAAKAQEPDARQMAPSPVAIVESPAIPPMSPPALARMNAPRPPIPPPPPPPPPPAAPQAVADRAEQQEATGEIVVTGTRLNESKAARAVSVNDNAAFLRRLQARIRANDRGAVARLIALPLRVNGPGGPQTYGDRRSIERDFDKIFTPRVRQAILAERPSAISVRDQGAMIGDGAVWISRTCREVACASPAVVRITAINP